MILAIEWGHRGQLDFVDATLFATKLALILAAIHQWWFVPMLPHTCSQPVWKLITEIIVVIFTVGAMFGGVATLLMSERSEIAAVIGAGLLFGTGWVAQRIHTSRVLNSPTDFVMSRPTQLAAAQRQQKATQTGRGPLFWPRPVEPLELP